MIVHGPAGCGKTCAVQVAARELGLDVVEWVNPVDENTVQTLATAAQAPGQGGAAAYVPALAKFEEFLLRASRPASTSLQLRPAAKSGTGDAINRGSNGGGGGGKGTGAAAPSASPGLVLIDDAPNVVERTRGQYHACLYRYLRGMGPVRTVVLVATELFASEAGVPGALPADLLNSPRCTVVKFNPVANTILSKALERVVAGELRARRLRARPTADQLKDLVANAAGDVRCAINSLHFALLLLDLRGAGAAAGARPSTQARALPMELLGRYDSLLRADALALEVDGGVAATDLGDARPARYSAARRRHREGRGHCKGPLIAPPSLVLPSAAHAQV